MQYIENFIEVWNEGLVGGLGWVLNLKIFVSDIFVNCVVNVFISYLSRVNKLIIYQVTSYFDDVIG